MTDTNLSLDQATLGQSQSVLSEKVNRALEVRTDTPAMKAALDALCHLHPADQDSNGTFSYSVDSRSVRVAIEQDALQQALLLQNELKSLVSTIQELRQGVSEIAATAHRVREATHINVVTTETENTMFQKPKATESAQGEASALQPPAAAKSDKDALEQEQKLAAQLSDAFMHRDMARKRLEAAHAFLEKFDLSQEDSRLLDHYTFDDVIESTDMGAEKSIPNGMAFLHALERVRKIRLALIQTFGTSGDLSVMQQEETIETDDRRGLGASSALRMMESLAQKQERAYERLYHWLQKYLNLFSTSQSSPPVDQDSLDEALQHPFVKRSLYTLRHVPAFYSHTLELIASSRRSEETRRFLLALTSGYGGLAPIEMKAHDSVAYVGDMLAFSFKAFSVEADVAKGLINYIPEDEQMESSAATQGEGEGGDDDSTELTADYMSEKPISALDMLSISMSGLARPLKSRILQVVATLARRPDEEDAEDEDDGLGGDDFEEEGAVVRTRLTHLYEICGLLLFYKSAMEKAISRLEDASEKKSDDEPSEANPVVVSLIECLVEATQAYEATIRVYGAMLDQLSATTGDSEASLVHAMIVLVASVRQSSPGFSNDISCPKECDRILSIEWVTETLVEAGLAVCKSLDDAVMLKQSVAASKNAGMKVLAAERLDEKIDEKEKTLIDKLVDAETGKVLDLCGLKSMASAWKRWQEAEGEGMLMATYPGLTPEDVEAGMKEFYASLYSPPLPSLETVVKDPVLRKASRSKIAENVCQIYTDLYECMMSTGKGGYDDVGFLSHTPDQVRTLFSA